MYRFRNQTWKYVLLYRMPGSLDTLHSRGPTVVIFHRFAVPCLYHRPLALHDMLGNSGHVIWVLSSIAILTLFALPPCVTSRPIPQAASKLDGRQDLAMERWSKDPVFTFLGTVTALCAILFVCWVIGRPRWFCILVVVVSGVSELRPPVHR